MNSHTTHLFYVSGMHCKACTLLVEGEAGELSGVTGAKASLETNTLEVTGDLGNESPESFASKLSTKLSEHGYKVSTEKIEKKAKWSEFRIALPVAIAFAALFVILQKIGIVNMVNIGSLSYGTAFVIGLVASVSSCMAVVGGLVLSMSATFAKKGDRAKPQILFHVGRLVSFFVLGGVIGAIGSAFTLGSWSTFVLGVIVGLVMLLLGIQLLDVFPWAQKFVPAMPKFLSRHALGATKLNHTLTPLLVGIVTFFLPCGFTQSMQIYALSTGSFVSGALTMLSFAFGTLPVLAILSFSSSKIKGMKSGVFFKSAGLVVIFFALFNILNSLAAVGIIQPLFSF